jgi:hypothetical protein
MPTGKDSLPAPLGVRASQLATLLSAGSDQAASHAHSILDTIARDALFIKGDGTVVRRDESDHFVHLPDLDGPIDAAIKTGFVRARWDFPEGGFAGADDPLPAHVLRLTVHGSLAREELGRFLSSRHGRD